MNETSLETLDKSELIAMLKESQEQKKDLEYLLENINGISWEFDLVKDKFTYVSANAKSILGYEREEWGSFESWANMIYEEDRKDAVEYCSIETKKGKNHFMEYRMVKKSGEPIWILDIITVSKDENDNPIKLHGFNIDIDEKKKTSLALEKNHKYLESIINNIDEPIMVIRDDYTIDLMNDALKKNLHKIEIADPEHPKCYEVSHHRSTPCDTTEHPCPLKNVLQSKKAETVIHTHTDFDKNDYFVELRATPLFDEHKNCVGIIESAHNITEHLNLVKELEDKSEMLDYKAHHDCLTALPNRVLFDDRLEQAVATCNRENTKLALMFLDLDNFKTINDTLGHDVGDIVLKEVATRVSSLLRATDTLSRLGGDEFTAIIKNVNTKEDVSKLAKKIIKAFKAPLIINENEVELSGSIGISLYPESSYSDLLRHADIAMYRAKKKGKDNFQHYYE
ncbi:diguanylate cyclase [Sulfurimonas aquatica]|uniref:Diguanylate cyclase n=1 Tax=Sulfurimonas aquatica TaxID=2672570 RepID=A0A975AY73_9BACT|nr:sensor domain-containing diguanylate cyclase [Sulfurimonas aquatica]QSZ40759.1 diguanylate cyclase [Sulfurimonas aquatica]